MKLIVLKLKKLLPIIFTKTFLFSLNIVPANAVDDGDYYCGNAPIGSFSVVGNVVTGNFLCSGAVNIPDGVTRIANDAFYETLIDSVNIPNTVTQIGDAAFYNTSLVSVTIPDSVTIIGDYAFNSNIWLTSVTFGNRLTTIGEYAFSGTNLSSVTFPNSVTTIRGGAFNGISTLTSVTFGNSVTTIGSGAFGFTSLSSVTIPNTVTEIGNDAFESTELVSVIIPDSVITLGNYVFQNTSTLTSVTIGNRVTSIGDDTFNGTRLTSVTIPNSVTTIGNRAFAGVSSLTSVIIGNRVTSIGANAFQGNTSLTSVTFLGNEPATFADAFSGVPTGTKANVTYNATGFPANGSNWKGLIISYGSAPSSDSVSTKTSSTTPTIIKTADVVFNLRNIKYLSKDAMKTKLSKNKSFKRVPEDLYKYSIFKASKKTCAIQGNYVTSLKKTGTCNLYATRTTTKGVKYKYWVQINYTK